MSVHEEFDCLYHLSQQFFLVGNDFKITSVSAGIRIKDLSSCATLC